jgi:hypothetical protein
MTKVGYLLLSKCAFAELNKAFVLLQGLEYYLQVLNMIFQGFGKDKDIIHENQHKSPHVFSKTCIHQALK